MTYTPINLKMSVKIKFFACSLFWKIYNSWWNPWIILSSTVTSCTQSNLTGIFSIAVNVWLIFIHHGHWLCFNHMVIQLPRFRDPWIIQLWITMLDSYIIYASWLLASSSPKCPIWTFSDERKLREKYFNVMGFPK